jgi:hypothetical protein
MSLALTPLPRTSFARALVNCPLRAPRSGLVVAMAGVARAAAVGVFVSAVSFARLGGREHQTSAGAEIDRDRGRQDERGDRGGDGEFGCEGVHGFSPCVVPISIQRPGCTPAPSLRELNKIGLDARGGEQI